MRCRWLTRGPPPPAPPTTSRPRTCQSLSREEIGPSDSSSRRRAVQADSIRITPPLLFRFALLPSCISSQPSLALSRPRPVLGQTDGDRLLRLFTFLPERPLFSVPDLRFFHRAPFWLMSLQYFLAMAVSRLRGECVLLFPLSCRWFLSSAAATFVSPSEMILVLVMAGLVVGHPRVHVALLQDVASLTRFGMTTTKSDI